MNEDLKEFIVVIVIFAALATWLSPILMCWYQGGCD